VDDEAGVAAAAVQTSRLCAALERVPQMWMGMSEVNLQLPGARKIALAETAGQ
jgi:hypothetical protein